MTHMDGCEQAEKAREICYAVAVVICHALAVVICYLPVRLRIHVPTRPNSREWWLQKCIIEHKMQVICYARARCCSDVALMLLFLSSCCDVDVSSLALPCLHACCTHTSVLIRCVVAWFDMRQLPCMLASVDLHPQMPASHACEHASFACMLAWLVEQESKRAREQES